MVRLPAQSFQILIKMLFFREVQSEQFSALKEQLDHSEKKVLATKLLSIAMTNEPRCKH